MNDSLKILFLVAIYIIVTIIVGLLSNIVANWIQPHANQRKKLVVALFICSIFGLFVITSSLEIPNSRDSSKDLVMRPLEFTTPSVTLDKKSSEAPTSKATLDKKPSEVPTPNLIPTNTIQAPSATLSPESGTSPVTSPSTQRDDGTNLILNNSFDDGDAGSWPTGEEEGYSALVADGRYSLSLATDNLYLFLHPDEAADFGDGAIAAQVQPEGDGLAGIMARYSEVDGKRSMYVCWINNERKFACSKDVDNNWTVMVKPQTHDSIQPDTNNKIVLAVVGNEFSFQINDQEVASFTDDSLKTGAWGVYAETTPGNFKVHYDHIAVATMQ